MKTVIILQARMSSTRLPEKVLKKFANKPMLHYVFLRASAATVNKVIIATSTDRSDDPIVAYCQQHHFPVFRGNLNDVLDRFYHAAKFEKADVVIRVTADCPLIDGGLISQGLTQFLKEQPDYLSNTVVRTYPRGFDFEIFTFKALETAWRGAGNDLEREHVTPYIYRTHPEKFIIRQLTQQLNASRYQLTVDTAEDLKLLTILIEKYHAHHLDYKQIIALLDAHPELSLINQGVARGKI